MKKIIISLTRISLLSYCFKIDCKENAESDKKK
jgi:hypothetical protein